LSRTAPPRCVIYPRSLHDALPIFGGKWFSSSVQITSSELPESLAAAVADGDAGVQTFERFGSRSLAVGVPIAAVDAEYFEISSLDRKSTRLNSSHVKISYAVFCLK